MVRDYWYAIATSAELKRGRPLALKRFGRDLVLWRTDDGIAVTDDRCPHRGASLSAGKVVDGCIECPFHGFLFRPDGQCTRIPAQGDQPPPKGYGPEAFVAREARDFIWLWWGEPRDELPELPWFADPEEPDERFYWAGFDETWPVHWTRAAENQLDFTHLPFVHANTIGRAVKEEMVVDTRVEGSRIRASLANQDLGDFFIELVGPNLWRNRIGGRGWIVVVFVPIDEEHTHIYIRYYQRMVALPVLGPLVAWAMNWVNRYILAQDKRVVLTQRPIRGDHKNGEMLVKSDGPIIAFRRWRHAELHKDDEA
ncbi:MAG: aromatic ring-hydroxylating dioxygenase subunit alpha [Deltaproteobacteria bacterium]|nr:MAG: aromatic ring-hydroxylating dioxygenase subunit alpha [Deltaproteobacteria bacterium]